MQSTLRHTLAVAATGVAGTRLVAAGAGEAPETRAGAVAGEERGETPTRRRVRGRCSCSGTRTARCRTRRGTWMGEKEGKTDSSSQMQVWEAEQWPWRHVEFPQVPRGERRIDRTGGADVVRTAALTLKYLRVASAVAAAGVRDARELHETRTALLARIAVEARVALALHLRGSDV